MKPPWSHARAPIAALVDDAVSQGLGSAVALAVWTPERAWYHCAGRTKRYRRDGQGTLLPDPGLPIGPTTAFDLASLTKPLVTSTLIAQDLSSRTAGYDLDTPLDRLWAPSRNTPLAELTVSSLIGHGSGLPAWHDFYQQACEQPDRAKEIQRLVLATPLATPPGTQAVYSDLGFLLLGWMLEAVHGQPLDRLYQQRIAKPLSIHSGFRPLPQQLPFDAIVATEIWPPRCSDGRPLQGAVHDDNSAGLNGISGHAGLFGSVVDVVTQAQSWLRAAQGKPADRLGLDPDVVQAWLQTAAAPSTTWRLGWDTPSRPGSTAGDSVPETTFGHLGFTGTSLWISPARSAIAVLLSNRVHPDRAEVQGIRALRRSVHDAIWLSL